MKYLNKVVLGILAVSIASLTFAMKVPSLKTLALRSIAKEFIAQGKMTGDISTLLPAEFDEHVVNEFQKELDREFGWPIGQAKCLLGQTCLIYKQPGTNALSGQFIKRQVEAKLGVPITRQRIFCHYKAMIREIGDNEVFDVSKCPNWFRSEGYYDNPIFGVVLKRDPNEQDETNEPTE